MIKLCGALRIGKPNQQLEQRITECVRRREIVRLRDLAEELQTDTSAIRHELENCVAEGKIECLRPTAVNRRTSEEDVTYYRWIADTDRDYLWQKELATPAPEESDSTQLHADDDLDAQDLNGHGIGHVLDMLRSHILPRAS